MGPFIKSGSITPLGGLMAENSSNSQRITMMDGDDMWRFVDDPAYIKRAPPANERNGQFCTESLPYP
jgi:hypothetical protein